MESKAFIKIAERHFHYQNMSFFQKLKFRYEMIFNIKRYQKRRKNAQK